MRAYLIVIFQFFSFLSFAQSGIFRLDSIGTSFANDLVTNGFAESAIVLSSGCTGCYSMDNCQCEGGVADIYILWNYEGLTIKKINCCTDFYGKKITQSNILDELKTNSQPVFTSQFEFDYIEAHGDFNRLKLVTKDSTFSIYIPSVLFNEDYKFRTNNLNQPAKKYLDQLLDVIKIANKSDWVLEH
jgi:hypothetical protein